MAPDSNSMSPTIFQRQIGLLTAIGFVVSIIIGSGIFISPKGVFQYAQCSYFNAILVWSGCGLYSMLGALCFAELGTTILRSGGEYAYLKAGFGSLVSFLFLWINVVVLRPASQAIIALTFAYYLVGAFIDNAASCDFLGFSIDFTNRLIAALALTFLALVNCINVKWALQVQNVFTFLKISALLAIIVAGIGYYFLSNIVKTAEGSESPLSDPFTSNNCESRYSLSIYSGLFAFGGWNYLNIVTDELRNPYKNLPRAALAGILISTLIYVLANVSYFLILTPEEILTSAAIALTFGRKIIGPVGNAFISLAIATSALGSLNATLFTTSRLFCIGAQERHLPAVLGMLHFERCTPVVSLVFSVFITLLMLLGQDIFALINYFSFSAWLWTGIAVGSGVYLRHKKPGLERPIRLPLALHYLFTVLCLLLTALAIQTDPLNSWLGLRLTLFGLPVYYLKLLIDRKQLHLEFFNIILQKLFMVVNTEEEDAVEQSL